MSRLWAFVLTVSLIATPLFAQKSGAHAVAITRQADTVLRFTAAVTDERGVAHRAAEAVTWSTATAGVVRMIAAGSVAAGPGVVLVPLTQGGTWVRAAVSIAGRRYVDSVYVVAAPEVRTGARVSAVESMLVYTVHPVTRARTSLIRVGETLQACVQFIAANRTLIADSCAIMNPSLPYAVSVAAMQAFSPGRTFVITSSRSN